LIALGYRTIAGIDEVGRGALAGPVVAAAVVLPVEADIPWLSLVRDSKQLTPQRRERVFDLIMEAQIPFGLGAVSHALVDALGIVPATRMAMNLAVDNLGVHPDYLLIDAVYLPDMPVPQRAIIRGDQTCLSIACASIVAKVSRDRHMGQMEVIYPGYGLAVHKGYGTPDHLQRICEMGPCAIHRRTFAPFRPRLLI
jgi:ribonuclease HII